VFLDSKLDKDSASEVVNLLPVLLAWDRFYQNMIKKKRLCKSSTRSSYTFKDYISNFEHVHINMNHMFIPEHQYCKLHSLINNFNACHGHVYRHQEHYYSHSHTR
jgi:hypothetical protein